MANSFGSTSPISLSDNITKVLSVWEVNKETGDFEHSPRNEASNQLQKKPSGNNLREERKNNLKRKSQRKGNKSNQKILNHTKVEEIPSLETLVLSSVIPDAIFNKLSEQVENGNPLLGIQILIKLPENLQKEYYSLIHFPFLIIEMLVMIEKLELVKPLLQTFPELIDNDLLVNYATKALTIRGLFSLQSISDNGKEWRESIQWKPTSFSLTSDCVVTIKVNEFVIIWDYFGHWKEKLTGNDNLDKKIRSDHFFAGGTPNVDLANSILSLSKSKLNQNSIDVCDNLSEISENYEELEHLRILGIMKELLVNSKKSLLEDASNLGESGLIISLYDSYLHDVDVLRSLVSGKFSNKISLLELSDFSSVHILKNKRKLRDLLTLEGKFELALQIGTKYQLKSEPVWASWGLSLLQEGKYELAREKFKYFLSSSDLSKTTNNMILNSINKILCGDSSNVDPKNFDECIYYLSTYGTPQVLLQFWAKNRKFDQVLNYIPKINTSTFQFDEFFQFLSEQNLFEDLLNEIKKSDPNLENFKNFSFTICSYLNKMKDFETLLNFQELMKDWVRAGLTCIKLYVEGNLDPHKKDFTLEKSLNFFLTELQKSPNEKTEQIMSDQEISKVLKKIKYQKELNYYFRDIKSEFIPENVKHATLFGSANQKRALVEFTLLQSNFDLAFAIMLNLNLPFSSIFCSVISTLVSQNQFKTVKLLLERIQKVIQDKEEWDKIIQYSIKLWVQNEKLKTAIKWINLIHKEEYKIDCFILCGKLKSAYLLAVKLGQRHQIEKIRDEAKLKNCATEYQLCEKYLSLTQNQTTNVEENKH